MKKTHLVVLLSIFALAAVSACKKYDDGPALSLLTKKQRLCRKWMVSSVGFGGFTYQDTTYSGNTYEFMKNGDATITEGNVSEAGSWAFTNEKEDLVLTRDNYAQTFEIKRLTNKELWVEFEDATGKEFMFKLDEVQ